MAAASSEEDVRRLADHLFRREAGKMISILTGVLGARRLELAEDAVQESLIRAMKHWPYHGIPDNPSAWLLRTAKNLALDHVRRESNFQRKQPAIVTEFERRLGESAPEVHDETEIADDQLRLMFVCCHPVLPPEVQSALALKTLCGLSPAEIATAFLASEAAIAKRLVRARQRLREHGVPFEIPAGPELPARLGGVLKILYLLFNEGHKASHGDEAIRADLCREAIRMAEQLAAHPAGDHPATHALLALMHLTAARIPGRLDDHGNLLRLDEMDRTKWDGELIHRGMTHLARSAAGDEASEYHLQAAIAACHTLAPDDASTDWPRILRLYDRMLAQQPNPVVALNRAVALARVEGPAAAIAAVEKIADPQRMEAYHLYHAVLGDLELRRARPCEASRHFERAQSLASTRPERELMARRIQDCAD